MNKHQDAVDAFTKSLSINEFQSHTHFRRAVSYFKLNNYDESLADLNAARSLGLEDEECEALNKKLVEKFGMKM